jgi:Family of unknown function (DUF6279)
MEYIIQKTFATIIMIAMLVLFSGCSMVRVGYDQGPRLVWWWLDGYVDFNREQKPHAKQAIEQWFGWHRSGQLLEYADWLSTVRSKINGPLTSEQVCRWSEELQDIIAPAFDHAVQLGTPVVLSLGEAQWRYLEQRYVKSNDKLRRDYLQSNPKDRLKASIKRSVKRIENLYGKIDERQRNLIIASIETSPFNPEAWLLERQRRQQVTLSTLQQLATMSISTEQAAAELRTLVEHTRRSDDPDYRVYQVSLAEYTCSFIARLHNSTTSNQRQYVHDKLKSWETDLRALTVDNRLYIASE